MYESKFFTFAEIISVIRGVERMSGADSDDWETLLDSGQLDANIKKLTILQRPRSSVTSGVSSGGVRVECSDDPRTQYRPAEPVIKIMKRPEKPAHDNNGSVKPRVEQKSLKQREQEYAEARQRILGSDVVESEESRHTPVRTCPPPASKHLNSVSRPPRGPTSDGSKGFQHR